MALEKYTVLRSHEGDRFYKAGETREADPRTVSHLVGKVLKKRAPKVKNKVAPQGLNKRK